MYWLPEPVPGTKVCGGFDGSESHDWTAIKLETVDGLIFTPRYGPDDRPTIWNPADWEGRIPRQQVRVAWAEIVARFDLERVFCDPGFHDETSWESEIEAWAATWPGTDGEPTRFVPWPTNQLGRMYPAVRRFEADITAGSLSHDGCPVTVTHMRNARKIAKGGDRYALGKGSPSQKIDVAVTSIICHEAAADARAEGWGTEPPPSRVIHFRN